MQLNDLLLKKGIDPRHVLVMRHRPHEPELRKVLPWLAAERPDLFNAYQQTQRERRERMMQGLAGMGFVASFIGHEPGKALFIGLYAIVKSKPLTYKQFWAVPAYVEMKAFGLKGWTHEQKRRRVLWFDLALKDFYNHWKGKLVIGYAATGHGGNRLLRKRDPRNFRFTILQRVSPDMEPTEVIQLESSWKERLHTRAPFGLNDN